MEELPAAAEIAEMMGYEFDDDEERDQFELDVAERVAEVSRELGLELSEEPDPDPPAA